jgi:hypothetical protein
LLNGKYGFGLEYSEGEEEEMERPLGRIRKIEMEL